MNSAILTVSHLTVAYESNPVLWDLSLTIPEGLMVALIGPNGAGKSTLLKTILGLVKPLSGQIHFQGKTIDGIRRQVAYVPQRDSVDWDFPMTLLELVLMGTYGRLGLWRFAGKKERQLAMQSLEKVGLDTYWQRQIDELSGGQKQRAFLARALCQDARLYFMDEPFAGIDAASSEVILSLLQDLKKQGKSLVVVHHDLEAVARSFDFAVLINMHLIASGFTQHVLTEDKIAEAYGKSAFLLDRVARLAKEKSEGR